MEKHGLKPKRRCFAEYSGIQEKKKDGGKSFSVKFRESIEPIFKRMTGYDLFHSPEYGNYFRIIKQDNELEKIKEWEKQQGNRIFLRDCLRISLAMDSNIQHNTPGLYSPIGELEIAAKQNHNLTAIRGLSEESTQTINGLPYYKDADFVCAVPSPKNKGFDSPDEIVSLVSQKTGKTNITAGFSFDGEKYSVKDAPIERKWELWEDAKLHYKNPDNLDIRGKAIILIDDKYQSGVTIQFVAMKLQHAGAGAIYGLSMVKTLGDDDNEYKK